MKKLIVGIVAHVDAGKTTLSESLLYVSGAIKKLGRVDTKDAYLDTYELERARGITIFSKQAHITWNHMQITLLDTPGHIDFSAEMERTLQVLDYAILVISGADGIQGHTQTLWRLLHLYRIPTMLFINKMDQNGTDREAILQQLKKHFGDGCIDFGTEKNEAFYEEVAMCEEKFLEMFLEENRISEQELVRAIKERHIFPCYFGSALKLNGVETLLDGLAQYTQVPIYPQQFGARVFKITRDEQDTRLTHMKITGGSLKARMLLSNKKEKKHLFGNRIQDSFSQKQAELVEAFDVPISECDTIGDIPEEVVSQTSNVCFYESEENDIWEEKVNQIRIYSGKKYQSVNEVEAGEVCAVTGLSKTYAGEVFGIEKGSTTPLLAPVLSYQILLQDGYDPKQVLPMLRKIEEEEPELHIVWNEALQEIQVQIMGEVQLEILKELMLERFGLSIAFGEGNVLYRETITDTVEGVGHFEPLRHYAEVHLLLEAGERGSGLHFVLDCSEDELDRNWQRLILTHLKEKEHKGVLTGSAITDMKISLVGGLAHKKHTEGGDFREATYRAVRQGLKEANSILLEPYYEFLLEVPEKMVGRAMMEIERMFGNCQVTEVKEGMTILTGKAPVVTMKNYQKEVVSYTKGLGRLFCRLVGYERCHNEEEVRKKFGYDAERDLDNPTGSVFCAHGAGFLVEWNRVKEFMHLESVLKKEKNKSSDFVIKQAEIQEEWIGQEEIEQIMERTFFANRSEKKSWKHTKSVRRTEPQTPVSFSINREKREEYLLVDGYNVIFAWPELEELAKSNVESARTKLMDCLCNYQGVKKGTVILVFDAYRLEGHQTEIFDYHNIHVVYTKEKETADQYIEKFVHEHSKNYHVTVATSDNLEQIIIRGEGADLLSARELKEEIERVTGNALKAYQERQTSGKKYLKDIMPEEFKHTK